MIKIKYIKVDWLPLQAATAHCSKVSQNPKNQDVPPDRFWIGGNSNTFSALFPWTKTVKLVMFIMYIM